MRHIGDSFGDKFDACSSVALARRPEVDQREDYTQVCEDSPQWRGILCEERAIYVRKHLLDKVLQECSIEVVAGWWEAVIICQ